jgi:hypothetical protein
MEPYYLQMKSPDDLVSVHRVRLALRIINPPDGRMNQRLSREVGELWQWTRCQGWAVEGWTSHLESSAIATVVDEFEGPEIGYSELINRSGDVEILSFGLLSP